MFDISSALEKLSKERPVFHSEADFQHALAWEIHKQLPESAIRLEFKPSHSKKRVYLDLWVKDKENILAIELKYKTKGTQIDFKEENFDLLNHGAQDIARYDFLKDIERLEEVISTNKAATGYAIFLTNEQLFWADVKNSKKAIDDEFRINEGRVLSGKRSWAQEASKGTTKLRERPIIFKGKYLLSWKDYSKIEGQKYGYFRYILVKVRSSLFS